MADKYLPAFPHTIEHLHDPVTTGMTLRDYFAAKALIGIVHDSDVFWEGAAPLAFKYADAMMEARQS